MIFSYSVYGGAATRFLIRNCLSLSPSVQCDVRFTPKSRHKSWLRLRLDQLRQLRHAGGSATERSVYDEVGKRSERDGRPTYRYRAALLQHPHQSPTVQRQEDDVQN